MRYAMMAANLLLRPKARQRFGVMAAVWALIGILTVIAAAFLIAGVHLYFVQAYGAPLGAILTASALLLVALCLLIGVLIYRHRKPPPPLIDTSTIALLGALAGLAGAEALSTRSKPKKD